MTGPQAGRLRGAAASIFNSRSRFCSGLPAAEGGLRQTQCRGRGQREAGRPPSLTGAPEPQNRAQAVHLGVTPGRLEADVWQKKRQGWCPVEQVTAGGHRATSSQESWTVSEDVPHLPDVCPPGAEEWGLRLVPTPPGLGTATEMLSP